MNSIKFKDLSLKGNPKMRVLLIALPLIYLLNLIGAFSEIPFLNNRFSEVLFKSLPLLWSVFMFSDFFIYKNYVEWNEKGINIKLNTKFWSSNFSFSEIHSFEFNETHLIIHKTTGGTKHFDISNIEASSLRQLNEILEKYV